MSNVSLLADRLLALISEAAERIAPMRCSKCAVRWDAAVPRGKDIPSMEDRVCPKCGKLSYPDPLSRMKIRPTPEIQSPALPANVERRMKRTILDKGDQMGPAIKPKFRTGDRVINDAGREAVVLDPLIHHADGELDLDLTNPTNRWCRVQFKDKPYHNMNYSLVPESSLREVQKLDFSIPPDVKSKEMDMKQAVELIKTIKRSS